MLKVIYSGQIGGVINTDSLSLAPLGLAVIICTLAACVHCLLINHYLTRSKRRRGGAAALFTWMTRVAAVGSPQRATRDEIQRRMIPLGTAGDCWAEWVAAFTVINSPLPNYLIHHMHTRLYCTVDTPTHTSHPPPLPPWCASK